MGGGWRREAAGGQGHGGRVTPAGRSREATAITTARDELTLDQGGSDMAG